MKHPVSPATEKPVGPATPQQDGDPSTGSPLRQRASGLFLFLVAGLAGGVAAWLLIMAVGTPFVIPVERVAGLGSAPSPEVISEMRSIKIWNMATWYALFGLAVGGLLGLAQGVLQRSRQAVLLGLLGGVVFGAIFGAAGGYVTVVAGESLKGVARLDDTQRSIFMHVSGWAMAALGIGLGAGLPLRPVKRIGAAVLAALGAGIVAGLLFLPLVSLLFPTVDAEVEIPKDLGAQLFWAVLSAGLMSLAIGRASLARPKTPTPAASA